MPVQRFVGLMSGTSLDGVDAALVRFDGTGVTTESSLTQPFPADLATALASLCRQTEIRPAQLAEVELALTDCYADAISRLLESAGTTADEVTAIGSHGQTIRHLPQLAFSWQIGNPARLAVLTGLPVVADFRRTDMALGGEGAPLAPVFHKAFFSDASEHRVVVNLGGIANVTDLPCNGPVRGWDTGPANTLLDHWYRQHHQQGNWDENGQWARQGNPIEDLVTRLQNDDYFRRPPPKSTGPEHFNAEWLRDRLRDFSDCRPEDVQASLLELTCRSVADAVRDCGAQRIVLAGGGAFNNALVDRLTQLIPDAAVCRADELGMPPDQVESAGFAWLARQHWLNRPGNLPSVTGASGTARLGAAWYPAR